MGGENCKIPPSLYQNLSRYLCVNLLTNYKLLKNMKTWLGLGLLCVPYPGLTVLVYIKIN